MCFCRFVSFVHLVTFVSGRTIFAVAAGLEIPEIACVFIYDPMVISAAANDKSLTNNVITYGCSSAILAFCLPALLLPRQHASTVAGKMLS